MYSDYWYVLISLCYVMEVNGNNQLTEISVYSCSKSKGTATLDTTNVLDQVQCKQFGKFTGNVKIYFCFPDKVLIIDLVVW